ncbi:MAG: methylmalonyl-CoA epimerase, partial [Bacteroidales bacterium]|nr:methylmalonyl-CoA epimerase [Bacteroidales bacterium]MDD4739733.1 methylmalonyl-CoA epimerase [Bacteroidales bacterium]
MKLKKIEHIGIAVSNLEEAIKYWEEVMGLKCYNVEEVVDQKVKTAFFKIGDVKIELLEATSEESSIASFIEKKGQGVHHIAFAVDNTDQALEEVEKAGVKLIDKQARQGAECLKIGFLH